MPQLEIWDHSEREHGVDLKKLESIACAALPLCLAIQTDHGVLSTLDSIEISLLNDSAIGQVHAEFMDLPEATDVITFHHGEILISVDTAAREAPNFHHNTETEVALYLIHGLLHLAGYDDHDPADFERMKSLQEAILKQCSSQDETTPL